MAARKKTTRKASKPAAKRTKTPNDSRKAKAVVSARGSRTAATVKATVKKKASTAKSAASGKPAKAAAKSAASAKAAAAKAEKAAKAARARKEAEKKSANARNGAAAAQSTPAKAKAKVVAQKVSVAPVAPLSKAVEVEAKAKAKAVEPPAKTPAPAVVMAPTAPVAAASKAAIPESPKASEAAPTVRPSPAPKAPKAPAPVKTTEKDEQGSEQKIMKNNANRHGFKLNEFVVYPAHGVGQIISVEEQEVAGFRLELFVINFTKDKMTLRVPTSKVTGVGMRKLSEPDAARRSLEILTGRARIKRTMWSRRAQEYEAKINSGDINAIAEVVRDLYRSEAQPEQSYSERQLYEAALDRMMREIAAVHKLSDTEALKMIETQLKKNQKRAPKAETAEGEDPEIEEAA